MIVKLDIKNMFNEVTRAAMIPENPRLIQYSDDPHVWAASRPPEQGPVPVRDTLTKVTGVLHNEN